MQILVKFLRDESGATAIEYALLTALMSVAVITALTLTGSQLAATFNSVGGTLTNANAQ